MSGEVVWRLEFKLRRAALMQLGVPNVPALLENVEGIWRYCTEKWLRLSIPGEDDNQSRWPTHPLWSALQAVKWGDVSHPALVRTRQISIPPDERLFRGGLGFMTTFMAKKGILDLDEGVGEFLHEASQYFSNQGATLDGYVDGKVREKGAKLATIDNRLAARIDQDGNPLS